MRLFSAIHITLVTFLFLGCNPEDKIDPNDLSKAFVKFYGGNKDEVSKGVLPLSDNKYLIFGSSRTFHEFSTQNSERDDYDLYIIKVDQEGNSEWERSFGSEQDEIAIDFNIATDGNYILIGNISTNDSVGERILAVNITPNGEKKWEFFFDESIRPINILEMKESNGYTLFGEAIQGGVNKLTAIQIENEGDILNMAMEYEFAGDVRPDVIYHSELNELLVLGTQTGMYGNNFVLYNIISDSLLLIGNYDNEENDEAVDMLEIGNGGYILLGTRIVSGNNDIVVVRIDENGEEVYTNVYGGTNDEVASSIAVLDDGSYIILGATQSYGNLDFDFYLLNIDGEGNFIWEREIGGPGDDIGVEIIGTDEGIVFTGTSTFEGKQMISLIKTDFKGEIVSN